MNAIDNELSPLRIPDLEDELTAVLCAAIRWGGSVITTEEYVAAKQRFRDAVNVAIEADRKRRGDPANESQRVYLHDEGFPEYLDGARCQYVIERGKPYPHGDPVAFVYEKEDAERIVAALNNEPRRGEPYAQLIVLDEDDAWPQLVYLKGVNLATGVHNLYLTPQPAEPVSNSLSNGLPDGYVLVPKRPTDAMLCAAQRAWLQDPLRRTTTLWDAMLAAAPKDAEA